jgi:hypothetical protein
MSPIPDWFLKRVVNGVQFLMALPLPGAPRHQPFDFVASTWVDSLWEDDAWDERLDNARLYRAFDALAVRACCWPEPDELLECLHPRAAASLPVPSAVPAAPRVERRCLAAVA